MRLFHFIKQQDGIRLATDSVCQLTSFVVSNITGWCTQQSGNRMFFHVFGHVDTNNGILCIEHEFTQCLTKFCLSYSGWSQENQRCNGLCRIVESCSRTLNGFGHDINGFVLTNDTAAQVVGHGEDASSLALEKLGWGDSGPDSNYIGNVISNNFVTKHSIFVVSRAVFFRKTFQVCEFFLKRWKLGVLEFRSFVEIKLTFTLIDFKTDTGNIILEILDAIDTTLFVHPFQV
mmetsp:Transcript_15037/g.31188  ORF Transcript_15037/g.31188 Transcript_15037/m.31188 type:complete len:232 (-) Transcript_15037:1420-2115(-)